MSTPKRDSMAEHAQKLADAAEELRTAAEWLESQAVAVASGRSVRNLDETLSYVDRVRALSTTTEGDTRNG